MSTIQETFLSSKEVKGMLNASYYTMRSLIRTGKLKSYKLGPKTLRFKPEDVASYLNSAKTSTHLQTSKSEANG